MAKEKGRKDKQHNGQKKMTEGQATPWPKGKDRRTSNKMVKRKRTEGQATQWPKEKDRCVACPSVPFLWPLCCLSFCLFSFGHCVACLSVPFFGHFVACPSVPVLLAIVLGQAT
jgi:hypothetical protein